MYFENWNIIQKLCMQEPLFHLFNSKMEQSYLGKKRPGVLQEHTRK